MSAENEMKLFLKKLRGCASCPRLVSNRRQIGYDQPILPSGNASSRILIIGQAPGRMPPQADVSKTSDKPFAQGSGTMLDKMLKHAGLDRSTVFIANILQCNTPQDGKFTDEEVLNCKKHLKKIIDITQPKVVVTLGKFAAMSLNKSFFPKDTKIFNVWHPAFIQRKQTALAQYKLQWEEIGKAAKVYAGSKNIMDVLNKCK